MALTEMLMEFTICKVIVFIASLHLMDAFNLLSLSLIILFYTFLFNISFSYFKPDVSSRRWCAAEVTSPVELIGKTCSVPSLRQAARHARSGLGMRLNYFFNYVYLFHIYSVFNCCRSF